MRLAAKIIACGLILAIVSCRSVVPPARFTFRATETCEAGGVVAVRVTASGKPVQAGVSILLPMHAQATIAMPQGDGRHVSRCLPLPTEERIVAARRDEDIVSISGAGIASMRVPLASGSCKVTVAAEGFTSETFEAPLRRAHITEIEISLRPTAVVRRQ